MKQEVEVEPLTKTTTGGRPYTRRPEVERQVREILALGPEELYVRLKEKDYNEPEFIKSESLVYLIRHHRRLGDDDAVSNLAGVLTTRINGTIDRHIGFVPPNRKQECHDEIVTGIILPLIDLTTDAGDYAQVSFGRWVKYHILDTVDRYFAVERDERGTDSLTRTDDDEDEEVRITAEEFRIADLRPEEYAVFMTDALNALNCKERKAYLMRHMWGWEIEYNDPAVPTISGHFGVTPRTINNWLNSADGKLAKWRNQRGS